MQCLPPFQQLELTGVTNHSGCPIELQVVQHPTQGRANPPSALEGKGTNQANKKQKKNGNNKQVVGNDAAALSQGQSVGNPPKREHPPRIGDLASSIDKSI